MIRRRKTEKKMKKNDVWTKISASTTSELYAKGLFVKISPNY